MAYSNTVSQTVFTTNKVVVNAIRRCKIPAEQVTAEHIDIANDQLYLLLSELANLGVPLWCIEKQLYPLYNGVGALTLDVGTVDVLNSFYRTLPEVTGTDTDTSTAHTVEFESDTLVSTVGIFWGAAAVPIAFERSDDGVTWTTIQSEAASGSGDGEVDWYDLDQVVAASWFRVRATSGTLTFDNIYLGNNPQQIPLARMNRDDWTNLPNQYFQSDRVLQFWFDRQVPAPVMRFWPIPNEAATTAQIVVWRHRQIMDVGTLTQELEVPQRWYEAIVAALAAKMAWEMIEVDPKMIPLLEQKAAQSMKIAQDEERDNSPVNWQADISMYTA